MTPERYRVLVKLCLWVWVVKVILELAPKSKSVSLINLTCRDLVTSLFVVIGYQTVSACC